MVKVTLSSGDGGLLPWGRQPLCHPCGQPEQGRQVQHQLLPATMSLATMSLAFMSPMWTTQTGTACRQVHRHLLILIVAIANVILSCNRSYV